MPVQAASVASVAGRPVEAAGARPTRPVIVGIGGTLRAGSSSETALQIALDAAAGLGAETYCMTAQELALEHYAPGGAVSSVAARRLVELLRRGDGVVISTPGYHGGISGLLKNALDYTEEMAGDARAYLSDMPVGCIATARGNQAAVTALGNLRDVVHALRAFPTPYGAAVISDGSDWLTDDVRRSLVLVGEQVARLAALLKAGRNV